MSTVTFFRRASQLSSSTQGTSMRIWFTDLTCSTTASATSWNSTSPSSKRQRSVSIAHSQVPEHHLSSLPIVAMLYVQRDLSAVVKAVFDHWDTRKDELNHQYLYVANARLTPLDILASVKKSKWPFDALGFHLTPRFSDRQRGHLPLPADNRRTRSRYHVPAVQRDGHVRHQSAPG